MASPIEAVVLLCDAAVADPGGKMHMLGAGWSVTGTPTAPAAVAVLLKLPWDRTNQQLPFSLLLFDADGHKVALPGADEVGNRGVLEAGRPPGVEPGTPIDLSFQLSLAPMPLAPGRYEWRLTVADDEFAVSFQVRAQAPE